MRAFLIIVGVLELVLSVFSLTTIASDIQIIIAIVLFGFGITHLGLARK